MDRLVYSLLSGMRARVDAQAVTANNVANAGVPGFRRELSSLVSRYLDDGRVQATGSRTTAALEPGRIAATGQPLDVAIEGAGWLAVQAKDGGEAYTRRGDLRVGAGGMLENGEGLLLLGAGGPIAVPPGGTPSIAEDGTVFAALPGGDAPTAIGQLKLVDPPGADLRKGLDGLFRTPAPADPAPVRLRTGMLEAANIDPATALVELVEQSRGFDVSARLLGAAKDMDTASAALMRVEN